MKKIQKIAKAITILILTISLFGCNNDDSILPQVTAGYTFTIVEDAGIVTFINVSDDAIKYVWDFGDETTSTEINPVKSFATGTYTVVLRAINASGASASFESTITILRKGPASLPLNFDEAAVKYNFAAFNGASFEIVDNPSLSGTNAVASKVGAITNSGALYEGLSFPLANSIDLTADKSIKINVWSDKVVGVLLKLENGTAGDIEKVVSHGGTGWETLTFDYSSSASYSSLTIFIDGPGTSAGTFYIDDIMQIQTPLPPCVSETAQSLLAADFNLTFQTDPTSSIVNDGGTFEWITNPDFAGPLNSSCKVGKVVRSASLQYANNQINFVAPFNFTAKAGFKIKVWTAAIGTKVTVKLEGGVEKEVSKTTTKANEWEELTFDFDSSITGNKKIVLFFNLDSFTTGTFYFDDFKLYDRSGGGGGACASETAQSLLAADFNLTLQTNPTGIVQDGATFEWISNPDFNNAVNPSCKVAKLVRDPNFQYANNQINFAAALDFNANAGFKIKVWTPAIGTKVTVKLEGGVQAEVSKTTTKANQWEELTFDFATNVTGNNKIVLFFNLDSFTTGTFYFDDFKLYPRAGGGGSCPTPATGQFVTDGGFEANAGCWELIANGGEVTISTSINNGGSNSGQIKTAPLKNPALKQTRFGAGLIKANTAYRVTFDIKADANDVLADGAVFKAFTFSEAAEGSGLGATQHVLVGGDGNISTTWQTRTIDFTTAANVQGGLSLLFELVCGGADTCKGTINIDNVSITQVP